jgi:hypothetical protein
MGELVHRSTGALELAINRGKGLAIANGRFCVGPGNLRTGFERMML